MATTFDPLSRLPAELALRVAEFSSPASLASLTRVSKSWHSFVDDEHQDSIYRQHASAYATLEEPSSAAESYRCFDKYFDGVGTWKELCRKQALLARAWDGDAAPVTGESVFQVGNYPVWRFRPDFARRLFLSTSQSGGLNVTDFESGELLWHLPQEEVRPYAHLEYSDGIAVFDRIGNAIEVWKFDDEAERRGTMRLLGVLNHDVETRGFMLRGRTLCVVSTEGVAFVYDVSNDTAPSLRRKIYIEEGAVGHLDQGEDDVLLSMGDKGYHMYCKSSGALLGCLQPRLSEHFYHIRRPQQPRDVSVSAEGHGPSKVPFPPQSPRSDRFTALRLEAGKHPHRLVPLCLEHDEWGAGMISGNVAVGVSRGGRLYVCSDYRGALRCPEVARRTSAIVECESGGDNFDLGGWLSVRNGRVLFEVYDSIYVMRLDLDSGLPRAGERRSPILALPTGSAPQLSVPVSWMGIFDDNIMSTYTTLGRRQRLPAGVDNADIYPQRSRAFPTKAIRVVCLLPEAQLAATGGTAQAESKRRAGTVPP